MQLPKDFLSNMSTCLGDDYNHFIESFDVKQYPSIRLHPQKGKLLQPEGNKIAWEPNGYQLLDTKQFITDPLWHAGAYYVQESSSMFLGHVFRQIFKNNCPKLVLDVCAAPGGKSTHLLDLMENNGILISNEILPKRNIILKENLCRWGYEHAIITQNDPKDFSCIFEKFDLIVVDAPCSGEGLFRKEPLATKEWSLKHVAACSLRQKDILKHIIPALKIGGYLLYSTCTFEPSENEHQIQHLLQSGCFEVVEIDINGLTGITENKEIPSYHFYPHKTFGSGFYMAVLRKTKEIHPLNEQKRYFPNIKKVPTQVFPWYSEGYSQQYNIREGIFEVRADIAALITSFGNTLNITYAGKQIADIDQQQYTPSAALALCTSYKNDTRIALNNQEALAYLQGLSLPIDATNKGWNVVTYSELALGWVKAVPGRLNNSYPKPWRIKKRI